MPSLFQTNFERIRTAEARAFGVSVMARQDGQSTEAFDATWERPTTEVEGDNFVTARYSRKWRLPAASLVINGRTIKPAGGMVIKEVETGHRFQVVSGADVPEPELQAGNYQWLVYTNRISDG